MRTAGFIATLIVLFTVIIIYFTFNPAVSSIFPNCPFNSLTGLYCPGCGSQRAFHQLLHGNIFAAAGYNFLMVVSLPVLIISLAEETAVFFSGRSNRLKFIYHPSLPKIVLVMVLAFWVLRNIPLYPFTLLAPHH